MHINRRYSQYIKNKQDCIKVFQHDWDNLIILDAARYDFLEKSDFESATTLQTRVSGGSHSKEFLKYNVDQVLADVVWVTANPWVSHYTDQIFEIKNVWDTGWDDEMKTVPPETLAKEAFQANQQYENKRLVVHFMQPHYPFIGKIGREQLPDHRSFTGGGKIEADGEFDIWDLAREGRVDIDLIIDAYRENLAAVIPIANELADGLLGKTVITADHGNCFGERGKPIPIKIFGHPEGLRLKPLVTVPWVSYPWEQRRTISPGNVTGTGIQDADVSDRLADLGYRPE